MFGAIFRSIKESITPVGDCDDPDAPFKWAHRCGITRDHTKFVWVDLHPLSIGGGEPYDGENGPIGFTTRDGEMLDSFIRNARAQGEDVAGWIIEDNSGAEWERSGGRWEH
jgi:hypothetical protein